MKKMLLYFLFGAALTGFAAEERDPSMLFHASFDAYSANPDYTKGHKFTQTVPLRDLQLRMHAGVAGKGNALELSNREAASYFAPGSIDAQQGTVSMWVAPKNWVPSKSRFQIFFYAKLTNGWTLLIYKFIKPGYIRTALIYKGKEYAINVPVKDEDWANGKWHHLAVSWDNTRITFYMDGKKAKQQQYTKNPVVFKAPLQFPAKIEKCNFFLGAGASGFAKNAEDKTVFDEVKIYNRPLSVDEIRKEYEAFFPPQTGAADRPTAAIPVGSAITIDGKIDKKEWADATVLPLITPIDQSKSTHGPYTRLYMKQDAENYYFATEVLEKAGRSAITRDDDMEIWRDDSVEMHFISPRAKRYYQFIVNPRGMLFDALQTVKDFNVHSYQPGAGANYQSHAKKAAFTGENFWSVELAIPKKSLKMENDMRANFCRTSYGANSFATWAPGCTRYFHMEKFGHLINGGKAVRLENFEFAGGNCKIDFSEKDVCIYDSNNRKYEFINGKLELPAGIFRLESKGKDWKYVLPFYLKKGFDFSYKCFYTRKAIEVQLDLSSADQNVRNKLKTGLPVQVTLETAAGKVVTSQNASVKSSTGIVMLPLPANPVRGTYNIRVTLNPGKDKINAIKRFRIPDMTPFINKVADDHTVPVPWTPVKKSGGNYTTLNKAFTFGKGPFPATVKVDGEDVFKSGPAMMLNGANIIWSAPVMKENTGDRVVFEGTGKKDTFTFRYRTELWFDGMLKTDIFMDGKDAIKSLKLGWKVPAAQAQYLLNPLFTPWGGKDGEKLSLPYSNAQDFMIWTMGFEKGVCFHPKSQANFVNRKNAKNYTISRKGDTVSLNVDIITQKSVLKKTAQYTFVFMPTPAKPFEGKWRTWNYGDLWGYQPHESFKANGFGVTKQPQPFDFEPWTGFVPAHPEKFAKYAKEQIAKGSSFMPYSQPCYVGETEEAFDWFLPECEQKPGKFSGTAWSFKEKRRYDSYPACGGTDFADLFVWRAEKLLKDYPDLAGLYYDICDGRICYNTLHGHGGTDAFGQEYADSTLLDLREYFLRIRKVVKKFDKLLVLHAHNRYSPFSHSFGDAWFPGEQYVGKVHVNPHHFYCEEIPLREYQSAYSSRTHGCSIIFFSQLRRQKWVYKTRSYADEVHTMMYLTPVMLHDINTAVTESKPDIIGKLWTLRHRVNIADAVFHGYWFDKTYSVNAPGVYVSWYELKNAPFRRMIIIGNMSKTDRVVKLNGVGDVTLYDLWNKDAAQSPASIKVSKENFRVFGIK